jgi:hypothetical protein
MYVDGNKENSSFDLMQDIDDINKIIFKKEIDLNTEAFENNLDNYVERPLENDSLKDFFEDNQN